MFLAFNAVQIEANYVVSSRFPLGYIVFETFIKLSSYGSQITSDIQQQSAYQNQKINQNNKY